MKKAATLLFLFGTLLFYGQDTAVAVAKTITAQDTAWKVNGLIGLTGSMTQLNNWQGGGQNNFAIISVFNFEANYNDTKTIWLNKIDCQYGLMRVGTDLFKDIKGFRKNIDRIFAQTKLDLPIKNSKHWYYTLVSDFRTQFAPGYNYRNDSIIGNATSDLTSPAYLQLAVGFDFKPADYVTLTLAPLAGKITRVSRQYLADEGAYGVTPAVRDTAGNIVTKGKRTRFEFGGRVTLKFKKEIVKNVTLDTYIDLFSNYNNNPQNIDVVANNYLTIKLSKIFSLNIISQMVYDDDIIIKAEPQSDGSYKINGPRLQALTTISLGFGIKL
jgi:hypothetical protein